MLYCSKLSTDAFASCPFACVNISCLPLIVEDLKI